MQKLRRLPFFSSSPLFPPSSSATSPPSPSSSSFCSSPVCAYQDVCLVCAAGSDSALWLGDDSGYVHRVRRDRLHSWRCFDEAVMHLVVLQHVLLVIGRDRVAGRESVKYKVYCLPSAVSSAGLALTREARLNWTSGPVTCAAATPLLTQLAVGSSTAGVALYRGGDLSRERTCKLRHIKEDPSAAAECVTAVHFVTAEAVVLFVCTTNHIAAYSSPLPPEEIRQLFIDTAGGAAVGCTAIVPSSGLLLVLRDQAVFAFHHSQGNLSALPCEGVGVSVATHKSYLIAVTRDEDNTTDNNKQNQILTICSTLPEARFVAFGGCFHRPQFVTSAMDSVFVVDMEQGKNVIYELEEKSIAERLDVFTRKRLFEWAAEAARQESQPVEVVQEIYRVQADWLYEKRSYEAAMLVYCKTIGYVEASYVIERFLEAQRLRHLTVYLQRLHEEHAADRDHTVLLLKCYTKLKEIPKLEEFLQSAANRQYDLASAVGECRKAGYSKIAADIALRQQHHELYVGILIEDYRAYDKALAHLQSLQTPEACAIMLKYGRALLKHVPQGTIELISSIIQEDKLQVDVFIPLFTGNPKELQAFLAQTLAWRATRGDTQAGGPVVFSTYLELLLRSYSHVVMTDGSRIGNVSEECQEINRNIMQFLRDNAASEQDLESATCLCRIYGHEEGLVYACEKTSNYQLPLSFYLEKEDLDGMVTYCLRCGSKDPTLWIQALTYLSTREGAENHILEVLKQVDDHRIMKPLAVLGTLKDNSSVPLGAVKDYLLNSFRGLAAAAAESAERSERDKQEIGRMKQETRLLRTKAQVFQAVKCAQCGLPLELPTTHFFCMHSYHSHCVPNKTQCPLCAPLASAKKMLKEQREFQARNTDDFFKFLRGAPDGFEYIAGYFGKGMFPSAKRLLAGGRTDGCSSVMPWGTSMPAECSRPSALAESRPRAAATLSAGTSDVPNQEIYSSSTLINASSVGRTAASGGRHNMRGITNPFSEVPADDILLPTHSSSGTNKNPFEGDTDGKQFQSHRVGANPFEPEGGSNPFDP
eukprot:GHVS01020063.1.p1 GENE.GHVS01020063.1~~GHVS01020063.1.p1  ORF type:complete len:1042 (+),score=160.48 GHVS01020063.1:193-3318(+)